MISCLMEPQSFISFQYISILEYIVKKKSGLFCAHFEKNWTFFQTFFEKLDFFGVFRMTGACSPRKFWKIWLKIVHLETIRSYYIPFKIVNNKNVQNSGPFWTPWDHGGCFCTPCTPRLRAWWEMAEISQKMWSYYAGITIHINTKEFYVWMHYVLVAMRLSIWYLVAE